MNDNSGVASGASLVGLFDNTYANIPANTTVQGAIGDIDSAIGNRAYTNNYLLADSQSVTASLEAIDAAFGNRTYTNDYVVTDSQTLTASIDALDTAFGNRTYTEDNYVTDSQSLTASVNALDMMLQNVASGSTGLWVDAAGYIYAQNASNVVVADSGNFGIGTTNPTYRLDVNGDARVASGSDFYVGTVGMNDNSGVASGASLVGLFDNTYANIPANTTVQGAIGDIDSAIGNRAYTNNYLLADSQSVTASLEAIDAAFGNRTYTNDYVVTDSQTLTASIDALDTAFGNRTYTEDNYVTDSQSLTASVNALDMMLQNVASGSTGLWLDTGAFIYPSNYTSFAITDTGRLGIGTTAPATALEVVGEARATRYAFQDDSDTYIDTLSGNEILFVSNGANQALINANGNLGIGTTAPTAKLQIAGNVYPTQDDSFDLGSSALRWQDLYLGPASLHIGTDGTDAVVSFDTVNTFLGFNVDGDAEIEFVMDGNGFLGIGTTAPSSALEVNGEIKATSFTLANDPDTYIDSLGTNELAFLTGGNYNMLLNSNGNLGIGTTAPAYKLDVNGDARVAAGSDFYVNATGLNDNTSLFIRCILSRTL